MAIVIEQNVVFGKTDEEYLTADTYKPKNVANFLPVLVLVHGGAFKAGSKEMYRDWGEKLATEGYFVMAINYRLASTRVRSYPEVLDDLEQAMNWLVLHANEEKLDVERIGFIGESAGAHLSTLFTLKKRPFSYKIRSLIGVYGVYDLVEECLNPVSERKENMFELLLGKRFNGNVSAFREASPINYVDDAKTDPHFDTNFFIIWGEKDRIVQPNQSKRFYEKLKEAGLPVEKYVLADVGHFWFNELPYVDGGKTTDYPNNILYPKIVEFLHRTVRNAESGNFSLKEVQLLSSLDPLNIRQNGGKDNAKK